MVHAKIPGSELVIKDCCIAKCGKIVHKEMTTENDNITCQQCLNEILISKMGA
jgi:hypothetical protein